MRVTNSMLVSNFMNNLNTNMNKLNKLQSQLATNRKYAHVSDDPISVIYSQQANYKLQRLAHFQSNVNEAQNWNVQVETGMMELNEIMKSAYETCIGAGTDVKTKSDMHKDAEYVKQLRDQIITLLNTSYGDKYVYGGYNNTGHVDDSGRLIPPFSASEDGSILLFNGVPVNDIASGNFRTPFSGAEAATMQGLVDAVGAGTYPGGAAAQDIENFETVLGEIAGGKFDSSGYAETDALRLQKLAKDILGGSVDLTHYTSTTAYTDLKAVIGQVAAEGYTQTEIDDLQKLASDTLSFDIGLGISMEANYNGISLITLGDTNLYEIVNKLYETLMFEGQEEIVDGFGNVLQEAVSATTAEDINRNITPLQDGQERVLAAMAEIGGRTNRLALMESRYVQDELAYVQMKSDAEDADQSEVIMNAKMAEAVYKAALATGATIIQPTLMDFLR